MRSMLLGDTRHLLSCFSGILENVRSDRLLATLLLLQSHGRLPAPEIARRLEVSRRTVSRDVEALSAAGVPVYCERGRNGGVALLEGYRTDVTGMTDEELRALVALGSSADGGALGSSLASASRKLLAALPEARRAGVDRARRRLLVEHQGWRRAPEALPALPALDAALVADERVRLQYATGDAAHATWRTVDPYGLVSKAGTWYLVAAHRGRPKMYRVSRVRAVAATGTPARRPDERDLAEVWTELRERLETPTAEIEVRLLVDPAWAPTLRRVHLAVLAGPWRTEGVDPGGREILVAPFRSLIGARAGLLGYGEAVEVLEPAALREEMADAAARVVAMYTRSSVPESSLRNVLGAD
ncbi:helix-turn-helix transcriptional regulator [Actinomycetospora chibensis]|uniref:Helix-turn-helix transcriptional regulator n=1 Tax=Actinomycetospora chibensis TaxID=663606 RepID=A0ABV9RDC0_9PSEU|nr:WYL domain-containing protein [Actinomycetospora chibensis]MDD7924971.1 WYL domain-containing protein [Actinomycetospora chibensis]